MTTEKNVETKKEKTPLGWTPKEKEKYWYADFVGNIHEKIYNNEPDEISRLKYIRVFKTQEEAEYESIKMKVTRKLEEYACHFDKNKKVFYMKVDFSDNEPIIKTMYVKGKRLNGLCFESEEKIREAMYEIGTYKILKYYFNLKKETSNK